MSWFVFMAVPGAMPQRTAAYPHLELEQAGNMPLGQAALGHRTKGNVFLVLADGMSHEVLGRGNKKRDFSQEFMTLLKEQLRVNPSVSVLIHWAKGLLHEETAQDVPKEKIALHDFIEHFKDLKEDVRYVIFEDLS